MHTLLQTSMKYTWQPKNVNALFHVFCLHSSCISRSDLKHLSKIACEVTVQLHISVADILVVRNI